MEGNSKPKGVVCVITGAYGFVASRLVRRLLMAGYLVRGTVRDPENQEKVGHLWELEGAREKLQLIKADLLKEGSFDEAVMGCHGVFHTASPVLVVKSDPQGEILDPAVKGTLNLLGSCKKNPSLKRVVLTSSSSTVRIREDINPEMPLDESSWSSEELCRMLQMLAERAAWEFSKENGIDLVTVVPSFVVGPSLPRQPSHTATDVLDLLKALRVFTAKGHSTPSTHQN